jgi:metal-responsive CopG/Arc/MetJ family transcriptional regulator
MQKISVTLRDEQVAELSDLVGSEYQDRSKAVRALIDRGLEYPELETENDRLRAEKRAIIQQREDHGEVLEYVERERDLQRLERERQTASLPKRLRWLLFGRSD